MIAEVDSTNTGSINFRDFIIVSPLLQLLLQLPLGLTSLTTFVSLFCLDDDWQEELCSAEVRP